MLRMTKNSAPKIDCETQLAILYEFSLTVVLTVLVSTNWS